MERYDLLEPRRRGDEDVQRPASSNSVLFCNQSGRGMRRWRHGQSRSSRRWKATRRTQQRHDARRIGDADQRDARRRTAHAGRTPDAEATWSEGARRGSPRPALRFDSARRSSRAQQSSSPRPGSWCRAPTRWRRVSGSRACLASSADRAADRPDRGAEASGGASARRLGAHPGLCGAYRRRWRRWMTPRGRRRAALRRRCGSQDAGARRYELNGAGLAATRVACATAARVLDGLDEPEISALNAYVSSRDASGVRCREWPATAAAAAAISERNDDLGAGGGAACRCTRHPHHPDDRPGVGRSAPLRSPGSAMRGRCPRAMRRSQSPPAAYATAGRCTPSVVSRAR